MSYFIYILYSKSKERFYIGQTEDVDRRLERHNSGESKSTKSGKPWLVVYTEEYPTRSEAMQRERYLKSPEGWKELQVIKSNINRNVAQPG